MKFLVLLLLFPFFLFSQIQIHNDIDGLLSLENSGHAVAISTNGSIIAIGSPSYEGNILGQVRIFENNGNAWVQIGEDIIGTNIGDHFGSSLSLSGDGSIVVIGAPDADVAGYVKVYQNINGIWSQLGNDIIGQSEFIDGDGFLTQFSFGGSVSISQDGTILAIAEDKGIFVLEAGYGIGGHLHMYENISGTWTIIDSYIDTGVTYINDVSLSSDGSVVAISGISDHPPTDWNAPYGEVKVYDNISGTWNQLGSVFNGEGMLFSSDAISHVSLSSHGSRIVIGGTSFKVYDFVGSDWELQGEAILGEYIYNLPNKVSLSDSGSILAYMVDYGLIRIYNFTSGEWSQLGVDINQEAMQDNFGASLVLSGDGTKLIIGGPNNDGNGENAGHARVFDLNNLLSIEESNRLDIKLFPNPATDLFTIELPKNKMLQKVLIYNSLGQFIQTSENNIIELSHFVSGLYYVEVFTNKGKTTKKLILK